MQKCIYLCVLCSRFCGQLRRHKEKTQVLPSGDLKFSGKDQLVGEVKKRDGALLAAYISDSFEKGTQILKGE